MAHTLHLATKKLYKEYNPYLPYQYANTIVQHHALSLNKELFLFINPAYKKALNHVLKQQLYSTSPELVKQCILYNYDVKSPLILRLPKTVLQRLELRGFVLNKKASRFAFVSSIFFRFREGIVQAYKLLFNTTHSPLKCLHKFCSIHNATLGIDPTQGRNTFIHWLESRSPLQHTFDYYRFSQQASNIKKDVFIKPLRYSLYDFDRLNLKRQLVFGLISIGYVLTAGILLLFGRWQLAYLAKEMLNALYFRTLEAEKKAHCYLFFSHNLGFRPLWTYVAESEKIKVINVFYASSYTLFTYNQKLTSIEIKHPLLEISSWSSYWVQGFEFKNTLSRLLSNPVQIEVVGAFPFSDIGEEVPIISSNEILIFDVDPSENTYAYTKHGYIIPNLTCDIIARFWHDLKIAAIDLNLKLIHKRKRSDNIDSPTYQRLLTRLEKNLKFYEAIHPAINTYDLLQKNIKTKVISLPFTSTGELAKLIGCDSVFYNPFFPIADAQEHARGVTVLNGLQELKQWLQTITQREIY